MKDLKPLLVVIFFSAIVYIGVEPVAHMFLHKKLVPVNYDYDINVSINGVENALQQEKIDFATANINNGKELVMQNCIACHALTKEGMPSPMSAKDSAAAYGVNPPDLSDVGVLYGGKFLVAFLANPVKAIDLEHKFKDDKPYPMPGYDWLGLPALVDIVAYLQSIANPDLTHQQVFSQACARCHTMNYGNLNEIDDKVALQNYMGVLPPDLSTHLKSRGIPYLQTFINNPQSVLHGTAMPRVGLNEKSQNQVIAYLESVTDPKKEERQTLGVYFIGYFIFMAILAYLWKRKIWSQVEDH